MDPTSTTLGQRGKFIPSRPAAQSNAAAAVHAERATPSDPSSIALAERRKEPAMQPIFAIRNLSVLAYAQGFTLWHYRESVGRLADMAAPGFFDAAADMFNVGDMLMISAADGGAMVCVATTGQRVAVANMGSLPAPVVAAV